MILSQVFTRSPKLLLPAVSNASLEAPIHKETPKVVAQSFPHQPTNNATLVSSLAGGSPLLGSTPLDLGKVVPSGLYDLPRPTAPRTTADADIS